MKQKIHIKKWYIPIVIILILAGTLFVYWTSKQEESEERGILVRKELSIDIERGSFL